MKFWISNKIEWWLISFASCNFLFPGISLFRHVANGGLSFFKNPLLQLLHILILLLHDWKLDGWRTISNHFIFIFFKKGTSIFWRTTQTSELSTTYEFYSVLLLSTYLLSTLTHSLSRSEHLSELTQTRLNSPLF